MTDTKENQQESIDESLLPLNFVSRIISLLYLVVFVPLFLWAFLTVITFIGIISPATFSFDGQAMSPQSQQQAMEFVKNLSPFTSEFANRLWSFLAPILSIIITVVLLRWLLFSGKNNGISKRLGGMVKDVPSLIAVVVIITLCLLPLLNTEVPAALSNIALVIVGFYFGTERRLKSTQSSDGEKPETDDEKSKTL
jgi:hypothetical protein